jgi:hypothetical protein
MSLSKYMEATQRNGYDGTINLPDIHWRYSRRNWEGLAMARYDLRLMAYDDEGRLNALEDQEPHGCDETDRVRPLAGALLGRFPAASLVRVYRNGNPMEDYHRGSI